jgi:cobalt-zinc-cadmium efflux system membrane fusion protein
VNVENDAYPGDSMHARIVQIGQVVDPNTRRVVARARIDNEQGKLLPEMFVRAFVLQDAGHAVRVPNSALVTRGLYSYVFVESAPGRFERRRVELSLRGADSSFVTRGLAPGEKVVVAGALLLDAEVAAAGRP